MRRSIVLALLAGCSFRVAGSLDAAGGSASDDAAIDAPLLDAAVDGPSSVCSATGLSCPSGTTPHAISCGNDCWYGCRDGAAVTEADAAARCLAWGGKLGRIDSAADETCMRTVMDGAIWVGLEQAAGQALPAQGWSWNSDGLVPLYVRWAGGQPNDGDGTENATEQCVYSSTSTFWQDEVCTALFSRFTCRR